jgi:hypothetical protein
VGLTPPLGPFFKSPRFRFFRSLCSSPLGPCKSQHCGHTLAYCAFSPDDTWGWLWSNWWSERRLQGKPKNSEKTCPSATLSHHKIPHDQVRFRTPDRSGGKPATNRLSYGADFILTLTSHQWLSPLHNQWPKYCMCFAIPSQVLHISLS